MFEFVEIPDDCEAFEFHCEVASFGKVNEMHTRKKYKFEGFASNLIISSFDRSESVIPRSALANSIWCPSF